MNLPFQSKASTTEAVNLWWNNLSIRQKEFIENFAKNSGIWPHPEQEFRIRMYPIQWEYMHAWPDSTTMNN